MTNLIPHSHHPIRTLGIITMTVILLGIGFAAGAYSAYYRGIAETLRPSLPPADPEPVAEGPAPPEAMFFNTSKPKPKTQ